jgi:O-antigen ligase
MNSNTINNIIFIQLPIILTSLIPALLITGPFLPDLAVSLCALIFLINTFKNKLFYYYKNLFFYFFISFCIYIIFSSLQSQNILLSFQSSLFYFRFGIFSLSTWYLLTLNKEQLLKYTYLVCFFCFLILSIDGFYQFVFKKNILGFPLVEHRISSFFNDEWILGSYLSRFYPILFGLFIYFYKNNLKIIPYYLDNIFFLAIILIFAEVIIFLSGERTSFFYLNFGALILLIQLKSFKLFRILVLIISFIIMILITYIAPDYKKRMIDTTAGQISNTFEKEKNNYDFEILSSQHTVIYVSAYKMFLDHKIFGIGPKNFRERCKEKKYYIVDLKTTDQLKSSCETHPHNNYLQLLTETGIVGFLFIFMTFLILIFYSFKHFFLKYIKKKFFFNDFQICLIVSVIISFWPLAPHGNFFNNWISVIYYFPVGFLLFSLKNK